MGWQIVQPGQWILVDEYNQILRNVQELGPFPNEPRAKYLVTGPNYESTEHLTAIHAIAAAESSVIDG